MEEQEKKSGFKKIHPDEEREGLECPDCHATNETGSRFCAECGREFGGGRQCQQCAARVSATADICEACGACLLEGACKFCNAALEEGAAFCAECGNPAAGVPCPQCDKLSCFDFCKDCGIPLTAAARTSVSEARKIKPQAGAKIKFSSNQEARRFFMAQKYVLTGKTVQDSANDPRVELLKLKSYLDKSKKDSAKRSPPLFSSKQKESIGHLGKMADNEIRRREEEMKRQEELRLELERERLRQETLLREKEEAAKRNIKGWHCNFANVFHNEGPCGCGDPSEGGRWETRDEHMHCSG